MLFDKAIQVWNNPANINLEVGIINAGNCKMV